MDSLLVYLSQFNLSDALKIEKTDRQFKALERLFWSIKEKELFLPLILANSTISYLLSSSWENYWEEFSIFFSEKSIWNLENIVPEIIEFLPLSKGNKRLRNHKITRLHKLTPFIKEFSENTRLFENNFLLLREKLARHMQQKNNSKTIVYTIKMLSYWVRIVKQQDIILPFEIEIPIDSRLIKLYEIFNTDKDLSIKNFYEILSKKTNIPPIHLDGILWTNYKEILTYK